jgi:serine/threonine-protein kinase
MHALHFGAPKDIGYLRPGLPKDLAAVVSRCLQKQPADRYQNAAEISRDLRAVAAVHKLSDSSRTMPTFTVAPSVKASVAAAQAPAARARKKLSGRQIEALVVLVVLLIAGGIAVLRYTVGARSNPSTSGSSAAPQTPAPPTVPDTPFALQRQAQTYLERWDVPDNLDRSIKLLNRAIELDRDYAPAYASLTFAYFEKNRLNPDPQWAKQATQSAARALQLNSDLADAHLAGGVAAMLAGKNSEAEREFGKAADLDPKSSRPHFWMGFMFNSAGSSKPAERELARALALNPEDWRARMNLGLLYYKTARYPEAATAWEQVSKLTPDNFIVLNNLAAVYHQLDRYEDAAAVLQRSLQIKPDAYTYGNLGTLRFFQGRYEDAVPAFEKAVKLESNEYLWWGNLGDGYRWAPGQRAKAAPAYENAIRLARERLAAHPDDQDARTYLALYLVKTGDKNAALAEVAKFDGAPQKEAENLFRSALVHELCGERDVALATLSAAVKQGYSLKEIRNEPELLSLRADPRYQTLVTSAARK